MRKLHRSLAGAFVLVGLLHARAGSAQTTFATSNDPTATLRVDRLDDTATVVTIVRAARSASQLAISPLVVLRDATTGISHELRQTESHASKDGMLVSTYLTFRAFGDEITTFDLLDVTHQQQHLYFSKIQVLASWPQRRGSTVALGTGTR